jgi:uncharacterized protein
MLAQHAPHPPTEARAVAIPPIRAMGLSFDDLPRHWFFGHPVHSAVVNALSLLFPAGERFFIRSVKHFEDRIDDPALRAAMRGFYGQEAHHQKEHLAANAAFERQGFELDSFMRWWEDFAFTQVEPRFAPEIRLAATAAAEHFTATLAEIALSEGTLDHAHAAMARLLRWHAAEEIEHKSVAFDVLRSVDPRYRTRVIGFAVVSAVLAYGWLRGIRHLLAQDDTPRPPLPPEAKRRLPRIIGKVARRLTDYLRPGFHPEQHDNRALARAYLASIERAEG